MVIQSVSPTYASHGQLRVEKWTTLRFTLLHNFNMLRNILVQIAYWLVGVLPVLAVGTPQQHQNIVCTYITSVLYVASVSKLEKLKADCI